MERTLRVATGESVAFTFELAGVGSRFIAVAIDLTIQIVAVIVIIFVIAWVAASFPHISDTVNHIGQSLLIAFFSIAIFMIFIGYFIVMEWLWDGRTPGKRLLGIRVIRDGGFPLDFTASVVRNVIRMLEFALGFYVISAISSLLSPSNRRLGDYAAGTLVVRDEKYVRAPMLPDADEDPALSLIPMEERDLIFRYVTRRANFNKKARAALAYRLAAPVRARIGAQVGHLDDDALLQYVVYLARRGGERRP